MSHNVHQTKCRDELRKKLSLEIAVLMPMKPRTHDSIMMNPSAACAI